ncbi:MAG TPA: DUF4331 family protein [Blastocatellia bacterium]|nr:DUF4331 family protein [Blastocatellia bacterium]
MFSSGSNKTIAILTITLGLILTLTLAPARQIGAADHGDGPGASVDRSADLNDAFFFLDPNDNSKVIVLLTFHGFIVPSEAVNFGVFDPNLRYRFEIEANGDATPDGFIDVTFSEKINTGATPQTATVKSTFFPTFSAPTTVPTLNTNPPDPVITTIQGTGIQFFAGLVDDPFFFDIPAFNRFVASVTSGSPNPALFNRGRDSFAGYNTLSIGFSIPASLFTSRLPVANNTLGLNVRSQRRVATAARRPTRFLQPTYTDVDRVATPAVNVALIPFARKNEFNLGRTEDDAAGRFADSIVGTLTALGTNQANINILAGVAVAKGDFLHLDLTKANSGAGGGGNVGAGFPNGRRLGDDTIDTILFFVANQNPLSDNVNANDVPRRNAFPFFGASQQPRENGDDNTKN